MLHDAKGMEEKYKDEIGERLGRCLVWLRGSTKNKQGKSASVVKSMHGFQIRCIFVDVPNETLAFYPLAWERGLNWIIGKMKGLSLNKTIRESDICLTLWSIIYHVWHYFWTILEFLYCHYSNFPRLLLQSFNELWILQGFFFVLNKWIGRAFNSIYMKTKHET